MAKKSATMMEVSKKDQILTLVKLGVGGIEELAALTGSRPSYIASVLRDANLLQGYHDLYTSTERPMNVYSKYFTKKLGFKNVATAKRSIDYLDQLYAQFERIADRAGQHHTMLMALTMRNRAEWTGKEAESKVFGDWLQEKLSEPAAEPSRPRIIEHKKSPQRVHAK